MSRFFCSFLPFSFFSAALARFAIFSLLRRPPLTYLTLHFSSLNKLLSFHLLFLHPTPKKAVFCHSSRSSASATRGTRSGLTRGSHHLSSQFPFYRLARLTVAVELSFYPPLFTYLLYLLVLPGFIPTAEISSRLFSCLLSSQDGMRLSLVALMGHRSIRRHNRLANVILRRPRRQQRLRRR